MPIFYVPDNTPSRNYGRNSRTEGYAHPAHGTIGGLAKSDTDPRNRGRRRSREEIEDSSRARYDAKRERLAKLREEVETKKGAEKEAKEAKRLRVTADKSAAALANNPEAALREVARQQTAAAADAKKGQPLKRLTPEEIAANEKAINAREAAARQNEIAESRARAGTMDKLMSERMKPEGPSLSDTLAASEAAGRPHVARAVSNLFASPASQPMSTPAQTENPQVQQEEAKEEPTVFTSREEMLRAAMNPSGRHTPLAKPLGSLDGTPGASNAVVEATHPQWKNTMSPSEREFVDSQQRGLAYDAAWYTAPTGLVNWYANAASQGDPTANSDLLGTVTPEYDAQRSREMNPPPSSIYTTPSYLRDSFRFDPDQGKFSTYKDSPEYQDVKEDVDRSNQFAAENLFGYYGHRPQAEILRRESDNGLASRIDHGLRHAISGNAKGEPSVIDFLNDLAADAREEPGVVSPWNRASGTVRRMTDALERRERIDRSAVDKMVDQENKDRRYQGDVGQGRSSDELVSRAFSGPAAETAPMNPLRDPEKQRSERAMQQHTIDADFHGGLPNRAVNLAGETVSDVMGELEVPESFKQSMRFRPGMEFGEPASRPTAIGANATGIGAGRPERKKETFMDWLRSNFPESFSDPNSMYYFPGKFD